MTTPFNPFADIFDGLDMPAVKRGRPRTRPDDLYPERRGPGMGVNRMIPLAYRSFPPPHRIGEVLLAALDITPDQIKLFWGKVRPRGIKSSDCWDWSGGRAQSGAPQFSWKTLSFPDRTNHTMGAAKLSYLLSGGEYPVADYGAKPQIVPVRCKRQLCCNPSHVGFSDDKVNPLLYP